jgi:aryl-alcohol dehydrogenase-like predicted oxidoreductase
LLRGTQLAGHATVQGTAAYAANMVGLSPSGSLAHGYTAGGSTGLTVSRLGFGTYRVDTKAPEHRQAFKQALAAGCNLIDTSTNYMDGDSERLVGVVLSELVNAGQLAREQVVVVSKIGYVQSQNLKLAEAREKSGRPYPDMVKYGDGIWHCLHPEFLADQLALSLDRLGLATLDVCLLHNPEYFLSEAAHRKERDLVALREAFYDRLQRAFVYFETQVAAGRLQYYGVSSNTVTSPADHPEATSLSRMLDAARAAAREVNQSTHHFRWLQCPMNLFESGALLTANTGAGGGQTVLDLARQEGVAVLVNRPLNAMPGQGGGILRLADFPLEDQPVDFARQRERVAALEDEYRRTIAPSVPQSGQGTAPADFFNWAHELDRVRPQLQGLEHWEQIEHQMIAPHVNQVLQALSRTLSGTAAEQWEAWRDRYVPELLTLLRGLRREATERSRQRTAAVAAAVDSVLPQVRRSESLSRKALWVLTGTPGVTSVLNGMRTTAYVEDSVGVLHWPAPESARAAYEIAKTIAFPKDLG